MEFKVSIFLLLGNQSLSLTIHSREEALESLPETPFSGPWDSEVLRVYVECGTTPSRDSNGNPIVRLKMSGIHEATVFSETYTLREVHQRLPDLDERVELLWILPEGGPE